VFVVSGTTTPNDRGNAITPNPVQTIADLDALQVLSHPLRVRILESLREPLSAAAAARAIGEPRQKVHYHLKELERVGLVERLDEQRVGNLIETRYRTAARSFVVALDVAWSDPRRAQAMREQHSLEQLVLAGARLQRDAVVLLDGAAFDGDEVASASVELEVRFVDETDRSAFLSDYLSMVTDLCERYGDRDGEPYSVMLAAYPSPSRPPRVDDPEGSNHDGEL
jgi:DNA-binding transcriptional ArsR family regulator